MAITPGIRLSDFQLRDFDACYASVVAGWVPTPSDLFWLAPATRPPLTAEKVAGWTAERDNPFVMWPRGSSIEPVGYGELNPMPGDPHDMWLGHLIVAPPLRGRQLGYVLMQLLLRLAFGRFGARQVSLVVFPENQAAVRCYLRCGLVADGVQTKRFEHVPGKHRMLKMKITMGKYQRYLEPPQSSPNRRDDEAGEDCR